VCRDDGLSDFKALHSRRCDHDAVLFAFDLIEHQGGDLHNVPLLYRKRQLAKLLGNAKHAIRFNEHLAQRRRDDVRACLPYGPGGHRIKRIDAPYRSGPSKTWLKSEIPL